MAVVLFPGFELLDVCAPGELLGSAPDLIRLVYCAQEPGPVRSSCMELAGGAAGPGVVATHGLREGGLIADASAGAGAAATRPDALFVPGGIGVRSEVHNVELLDWLRTASEASEAVLTVCTGSWLLGASGALDGVPATSNKNALRKGGPQQAAPGVLWQLRARWVEHTLQRGNGRSTLFVTSSGVSAGGDAALALAARLGGLERARRLAHQAEWSWQEDPSVDPFAAEYGLGS
jgi:putative intracellular protease/amidase